MMSKPTTGRCTHGTTLGSYCHECTSPKPTTAEILERLREIGTDARDDGQDYDAETVVVAADRLETAEANAALNRAMEVSERERANKAEATIKELEDTKNEFRQGCADLKKDVATAEQRIKELGATIKAIGELPDKAKEPAASTFQRGWICGWNGFRDELQAKLDKQ